MGKNLIIVGGGAGGASAAAEAKRRDPSLSVTMIEQGQYISFAACPMPYYISDVIKDVNRLIARTPEKFMETGVDVRLQTKVEGIDGGKQVVHLSDGTALPYDILVLGTGTSAFVPKIPGVDMEGVFTLKKIADSIRIKDFLKEKKCRKAVIVGAGFIGLEMSEALRNLQIETHIFDLTPRPAMRWDPELSKLISEELTGHDVRFFPNTGLTSIEEGKKHRLCVKTTAGEMEADMVLIAIGVRPNVALAGELGLQLGKSGSIQVDFSQRTSRSEVYAAGDCCEVYHLISRKWVHIPLGDIANKQGRVAGRNIGGGAMIMPGVVGAQSFKLFDLEVAATGLDEAEASSSGYHPVSSFIWANAVAQAMPDEKRLGIKLIADRSTGKLLGAQAVGVMGAVGRINTLSCALWAGMHLNEITYLDFAYSPPFSAAWDPIHIAAQQLTKKLN
jgi:CoA-dependent NAD(P)H sulfur oxidoreductase